MAKKSTKAAAPTPDDGAVAAPKKAAKKAPKKPTVPFPERLVLQRWAMAQLGEGFDGLRARLATARASTTGGLSWFAKAVQAIVPRDDGGARRLSDAEVAEYDTRIRRHTEVINQRRDPKVRWKYFQWLALLFTELYLDRWFTAPARLCDELNAVVAEHNEEGARDSLAPYTPDDLRRLAFWCATGSGKTLLLHVNLLQYLAACERAGKPRPNKVLVVCPREELARQHLEEFALSSIEADYFEPRSVLRRSHVVQVMEVTRLKEEGKKKTVDVAAFGDDNLVFVDEAHQGLRTDDSVWKEYRDRLSAKGFAFEYSATFGQAVRASKGDETAQEYARCILLDYAYKRFYEDGYGKDYCILNLKDDPTEELRQRYLVGCLLSYYQQLRLYEDAGNTLIPYGLARPLWVFVGGKVSGGKDDGVDLPEVVEIIASLQRVCSRREETTAHLLALLRRRSGILDDEGRDVFAGIYPGLVAPAGEWDANACDALYGDLLRRVFLTGSPGNVHVRLQRSVDHELVLAAGGAKPFGLVYVGKVKDVERLCKEKGAALGLVVDPPAQGESLFQALNRADSRTHVLIGSRKFTEGWNSWRVSTLGLMNFGRTEGSQVIQLFGRGVRLRGHEGSLRRSRALAKDKLLPKNAPDRLPVMETLGVFGIRADYMQSFEAYLRDEGLPERRQFVGSLTEPAPVPTDAGATTVYVPITVTVPASPPLYTFLGEDDVAKASRPRVVLDLPNDETGTRWIEHHPVKIDWYPQVQSERSAGAHYAKEKEKKARVTLEARHRAWLDVDALVRGLLRQREERGDDWCTLSVTHEGVNRLLGDPDKWYELYLPREFLELRSWRDVERWQAIAAALLGDYCEKFMARWWDGQCEATLRYARVTPEDGNFAMSPMRNGQRGWTVQVRNDPDDTESSVWRTRYEAVVNEPTKYRAWLESAEGWPTAGSLPAGAHLYEPLLVLKRDATPWVKVTPVTLDHSEAQFVRDLNLYWTRDRDVWLEGCELHLLRNQVHRGVRFFEANNFTPDFLVWLTKGDRQCVAVVDPKGIRNLSGIQDAKFALHTLIKQREGDVWRRSVDGGDAPGLARITLESFIVANTRKQDVGWAEHDVGLLSLDQWFNYHVVFQHEDRDGYVERILRVMFDSLGAP